MRCSEDLALEMCDAILKWKENHFVNFDTAFVESVKSWIEDNNDVSDAQYMALENIINRFRIKT